ncbi:MAG: hypothetical protein AAF721_23455 [Myxococcota bacterium]
MPVFLGAGLIAILGVVTVASGEDGETPKTEEAPPAEEAAAEPADADEPASEETPEAVADATPPEPEDASPVLASGMAPTEMPNETADGAEPARSRPAPRTAKRRASRRVKKVEPIAPVARLPSAEAKVEAALKEGWMRESGSLLLIFPSEQPMGWDGAKSLCQRRRDARLTDWRLARIGELEKLRASRALPAGTWWSATSSESGAEARILAPTEAGQRSKASGKALALCVHRPLAASSGEAEER